MGTEYRLPNHVIPIDYAIHFEYFMDELSSTLVLIGKTHILIEVLQETEFIKLNSFNIEIIEYSLHGKEELEIDIFETNLESQTITFKTPNLSKGKYLLMLNHMSEVNKEAKGAYHCSFGDFNGISTHFEPCDARTCFPVLLFFLKK